MEAFMKDKSIRRGQLVAAAALLALGSGALVAQEPASPEPRSQTEQQQVERAPQDQPSQERWDDPRADDETSRDGDVASAEPEVQDGTLDALTREHDNLSTFVEAVKAAGMEEALTEGTSYTIFAPTDEAFEQLGSDLALESENWEQIAGLLRAHIVADDVDREMLRSIPQAMTLDGGMLELSESNGELRIDNAAVVAEDIQHGNLRIYAIDAVLEASPGVTREERDSDPRDDAFRDDQRMDGESRDDDQRDEGLD
jgi:uncharacterized surface protein with fasciclin (FAS1) repeats